MKATETTIPAWQMAIKNRPIEWNLVFHCSGDPVRSRSVVWLSWVYQVAKKTPVGVAKYDRAADAVGKVPVGITQWRKAFASAIRFKSLKSELVYQQDFQTQTIAKQAVFEYIEICGAARRYNRQRRHSSLGYLSPFDYYNSQFQHVA